MFSSPAPPFQGSSMPLSGEFHVCPIDKIKVNREGRQRRTLDDLEPLAESIKKNGLIHPIVLTRQLELVSGERRLEALKLLGVHFAQIQYLDELSPFDKRVIELEENIKRKPLAWQEHNKAIFDYHNLQSNAHPNWAIEKTAEELSITPRHVDRHLWVRREINGGNSSVESALKFSAALAICERAFEREASSEMDLTQLLASENQRDLEETLDLDVEEPEAILRQDVPSHTLPLRWSIEVKNWLTQAETYTGPRFNFIHFDPPYGVNRHTSTYSEAGATSWEHTYEDTPEEFFRHLSTFIRFQENLCQTSCHLMLWFSMNYYTDTIRYLTEHKWRVIPHPLIWNKISTGIASDPNRRPRHVYETALLASLGDRPLIRPLADVVTHQPSRDRSHYSEKPVEMLEGFFKMLVDGSTRLLDPTCGSGSALRCALSLGAKSAVGWELDPQVAETATNLMKREGQGQ